MSDVPSVLTRKRGQPPVQKKQHEKKESIGVAPVKRLRSTVEEQEEQIEQLTFKGDENKKDEAFEEPFQMIVKTRDELHESEDTAADAEKLDQLLTLKQLATCTTADTTDVAWGDEFQAVDLLRRFAKHHQDEARRQLNNGILSTLVIPAASSLRSVMARNALLCLQDLILALKTEMAVHMAMVVPVLLNRACSEKHFLGCLAREVLDTTLQAGVVEQYLQPLLATSTTEKNAQIVSVAGIYVNKCVVRMDREQLRTFVLETRRSFVDELAGFLNCKVVECKAATRHTCQYTRQVIGNDKYVALVTKKLSGSMQLDVLKASEICKAAKAGHSKSSIRESMLQMKKQKQKKVQSEGDDIAVVVVAPSRSRVPSTQATPSS